MKHLTTVLFAIAFALGLGAVAQSAPPVFNGDTVTATMPTFNASYWGIKSGDVTDNTTAFNNLLQTVYNDGGGTILVPCGTYLFSGAIVFPNNGNASFPQQKPIRITSNGGPTWSGFYDNPSNGCAVFDLRYNGSTYNAKINTFGEGYLQLDHLTFTDNGTDSYPFFVTTGTTVIGEYNAFIGDSSHTGTGSTQDAWILGENGYTANSASISSGSSTLTIGAGDPPFTSSMVGYQVGIPGAGAAGVELGATISAYVSPTQVTLNTTASTTVTNGTANYFGVANSDINAAFQGYGSRFVDNFYSRIRHAITFNMYANAVTVSDEIVAKDSGSSETYGAPYYFSGVPGFNDAVWGVTIRGSGIEVTNYHYAFSLLAGDRDELFDGDSVWDSTSYFDAVTYSAAQNASANPGYSTVIASHSDFNSQPVVYAAGPNASTVTVLTSEYNGTHGTGAANISAGTIAGGTVSATTEFTIPSSLEILPGGGSPIFQSLNATGDIDFRDPSGNPALVISHNDNVYVERGGLNFNTTGQVLQLNQGLVEGGIHAPCNTTNGYPCSTQFSCTMSAATSCNATKSITNYTGVFCTGSYDHGSTVSLTALLPINVSYAAGVVTAYANASSSQTGTVYFDVLCL